MTVEKEDQYDPTSHLSYGDITVDNPTAPTIISIVIKKSKTDQGRKGVKVFIGKTSDDLCPVTALLSYLALRGTIVLLGVGSPTVQIQVCRACTGWAQESTIPSLRLCRSQLPYWGSNNCSSHGVGRLNDSNSRQMGKFIIQEIYLTGPPLSRIIVTNSGPLPNLVLEWKERHFY